MADKSYLYQGPPSGNTLPDGREVQLHPGCPVTLPEDLPWTQVLLEHKHLVLQEEAPKARTPRNAPQGGEA